MLTHLQLIRQQIDFIFHTVRPRLIIAAAACVRNNVVTCSKIETPRKPHTCRGLPHALACVRGCGPRPTAGGGAAAASGLVLCSRGRGHGATRVAGGGVDLCGPTASRRRGWGAVLAR